MMMMMMLGCEVVLSWVVFVWFVMLGIGFGFVVGGFLFVCMGQGETSDVEGRLIGLHGVNRSRLIYCSTAIFSANEWTGHRKIETF